MFAIAIRYLCGWSMASQYHDYEKPEWPPHPDRLYMALVAAHKLSAAEDDRDAQRRALLWLEKQEAPAVAASKARQRSVATHFVPTNDASCPRPPKDGSIDNRKHLVLLPGHRKRAARCFPVAVPERDTVHFIWQADPDAETRASLGEICRNVVNVGHSASLVQAWIESAPPEPDLVPGADDVKAHLRVPSAGRLQTLEECYAEGLRHGRVVRPRLAPPLDYSPAHGQEGTDTAAARTVFSEHLLAFRLDGQRSMPLEGTLALTRALRGLLLSNSPVLPEWLTGHTNDGLPSDRPHVALLPLANVGHEHGDGRILGAALALPESVPPEQIAAALGWLAPTREGGTCHHRLFSGKSGEWDLTVEVSETRPSTLRVETWTRPSRLWATVTPVVLDRHPKRHDSVEFVQEVIATSVCRIGLPRPVAVTVLPVSRHIGVPHARSFPCIRRKKGGRRHHTHAILEFAEPVRGPLLIGAGRYRGYGLLRPLPAGDREDTP